MQKVKGANHGFMGVDRLFGRPERIIRHCRDRDSQGNWPDRLRRKRMNDWKL